MNKIFSYIILLVISISLFGCAEEKDMTNVITIYTLNDFHGAIFEDGQEVGIAKIGDFLIKEKAKYPHSTLIISAGDMFQGTAVSSMTRGEIVVDAMNIIGFDAMTIGNHEFDWGIYGITRYNDGNLENGEANFPLLGANIYRKSTDQLAEWTTPYVVIERGGLKIGIIGTLGETQTNDILTSIIQDYQFRDQLEAIKKYTKILRTEENCDIVIVSSHSNTDPINNQLANLTEEFKIDAIINGHTHQYYASEFTSDNRDAPLVSVQSSNNGKFIGKITLEIDPQTKQVIDASSEFINANQYCKTKNSDILAIFDKYTTEIDQANEVLGKSGLYIDRVAGASWAANSVKTYTNTQIGIVNFGGIRSVGFPILKDSTVTFGSIFKIMPFENTIVDLELTGSQIKTLLNFSDLYFSANVNRNMAKIDDVNIVDTQLYTVSTIDYVYERTSYSFPKNQNAIYTNYLLRDHLVNVVKASVEHHGKWYLN